MIFNSDSSENIVLKALVDVMGLSIDKQPVLYKIRWIKKSTKTRVTEMFRVSSSSGKIYNSDVLRDEVDIDACHML